MMNKVINKKINSKFKILPSTIVSYSFVIFLLFLQLSYLVFSQFARPYIMTAKENKYKATKHASYEHKKNVKIPLSMPKEAPVETIIRINDK